MTTVLRLILFALFPLFVAGAPAFADDPGTIVVIANPSVGRVDAATLQRLYTGRAIEVGGSTVVVVNLPSGNPARDRFLAQVLGQDDEKHVAYWTVRRHIGKGIPPRELKSAAEVMDFVQATPGGLGYILAADARPGTHIVFRP
jgi:hypothetical protein